MLTCNLALPAVLADLSTLDNGFSTLATCGNHKGIEYAAICTPPIVHSHHLISPIFTVGSNALAGRKTAAAINLVLATVEEPKPYSSS
ncbi:hypothetical protein ES703_92271 [subsurface metagenome]